MNILQLFCANEAEQQEESVATGVETQTEAFDYLYRKTGCFEAPDKDAETQTEAFDYLYRKLAVLKRPTRTLKPRQKNLTILSLKVAAIKHRTGNFSKLTRRCVFTQVYLHTKYLW